MQLRDNWQIPITPPPGPKSSESSKSREDLAEKPRFLSRKWWAKRKHDKELDQRQHKDLNSRIGDEIAKWRKLDPGVQKTVLARAEAKRVEEVAWSRSLDNKVAPILTVAGFSIGGLLTLLNTLNSKDGSFLTDKPWTVGLLVAALAAFFLAAIRAVLVISPTVSLTGSKYRFVRWIRGLTYLVKGKPSTPKERIDKWVRNRYKMPEGPLSEVEGGGHLFFGHTARYETAGDFITEAIGHFANDAKVLRDTLMQGYINSRINRDKCDDIEAASQSIVAAIVFIVLAGVAFAWESRSHPAQSPPPAAVAPAQTVATKQTVGGGAIKPSPSVAPPHQKNKNGKDKPPKPASHK